jgi:hypothetical protein
MPSFAMLCSVDVALRLLATANAVPSSPSPATLMMEVIHSSETCVNSIGARRHIPESDILPTTE